MHLLVLPYSLYTCGQSAWFHIRYPRHTTRVARPCTNRFVCVQEGETKLLFRRLKLTVGKGTLVRRSSRTPFHVHHTPSAALSIGYSYAPL